jgi:GNAT superfamily N-acetyltransferase
MTNMPTWRHLRAADLPHVHAIQHDVHVALQEDDAVLAERIALAPAGCFLLERGTAALGYVLSHPWHLAAPPALNQSLGAIPADADCWYIHDLALREAARGGGHGRAMARRLLDQARALGFRHAALIAVYGSSPFWEIFGFRGQDRPDLAAKLASYGEMDATFMVAPL